MTGAARGITLGLLIASALFAVKISAQVQTGTVIENAPILLSPTSTRPLRVAAAGTVLQIVRVEGAWLNVRFRDPQFGERVGYVEAKFVRQAPAANLQPMDLSLSPTPSTTPPQNAAPMSGATPIAPRAAATRRAAGTASQTMTFRKVDYSEIVGQEEKSRSARLVLDPVGRTLTFADEGGGEAKAVYAKVPYESVTKIVYEQASHRRYTAGVLVSPFLFFTKAKKHWLTLEVKDVPELPQGFLYARLDKDNYRQILSALRAGTGLEVEERIED